MRTSQKEGKAAEWISWHEGAHLISKKPKSATFDLIQDKIAAYFGIENKSVGTRFNWYPSDADWKPFHHDSAAFNPERAKNQNITVGISLGSTRELAFLSAKTGERIYFPQTNGMLFSFGRDVNIRYKHGINALHEADQTDKGRISIILWGQAPNVKEENNSPAMLTDDSRAQAQGHGFGFSMHAGKRRDDRRDERREERRDDRRDDRRDERRDDRRDNRGDDRRDDRREERRDDRRSRSRERDRDGRRGDSRDRRQHHRDDNQRGGSGWDNRDRDRDRDRDRR